MRLSGLISVGLCLWGCSSSSRTSNSSQPEPHTLIDPPRILDASVEGDADPQDVTVTDSGPPRYVEPPPLPFEDRDVAIGPGLRFHSRTCVVNNEAFRLLSVDLAPRSTGELRVLDNPTARPAEQCRARYGGSDLPTIIRERVADRFRVLGASNGNFFHVWGEGFRANGYIWSKTNENDGEIIAPIQPTQNPDFRGERVFVVDDEGGHEVRISTDRCSPGQCIVTVRPTRSLSPWQRRVLTQRGRQVFNDQGFTAALRRAFPTMTLAMQINHGLSDRPRRSPQSILGEPFRCSRRRRWTCQPHPVAMLCARNDGTVSALVTDGAHYENLAVGMRVNGVCQTQCSLLYILDGGGSTQMGIHDPGLDRFAMVYAGARSSDPPPECGFYRPVEHYLAAGVITEQNSTQNTNTVPTTILPDASVSTLDATTDVHE